MAADFTKTKLKSKSQWNHNFNVLRENCQPRVLHTAKLPVDFDARKNVIVEFIVDSIYKVLQNRDEWYGDNISYDYLYYELYSFLGYTKNQIISFIPDAVKELNGQVIVDDVNQRLIIV